MDIIKDSIDKLTLNNRNSWKEYGLSHFKGAEINLIAAKYGGSVFLCIMDVLNLHLKA